MATNSFETLGDTWTPSTCAKKAVNVYVSRFLSLHLRLLFNSSRVGTSKLGDRRYGHRRMALSPSSINIPKNEKNDMILGYKFELKL